MNPTMATAEAVAEPVESAEATMGSAQQLAEEEGSPSQGRLDQATARCPDVYEPKAAPNRLLFGISQRGGAAADH
jgi:hypothetical protein